MQKRWKARWTDFSKAMIKTTMLTSSGEEVGEYGVAYTDGEAVKPSVPWEPVSLRVSELLGRSDGALLWLSTIGGNTVGKKVGNLICESVGTSVIGSVWQWWWEGSTLSLKMGQFFCTLEAITFDVWGRNHYVWYGWMRRDGGYTAMPPGRLLVKNWWSYGCFSPCFLGVVLSWFF